MHIRFVSMGIFAVGLCLGAGLFIPISSADQSTAAATADDPYSGGDPQRGQQVFASNGCGWCHEGSGRKAGRGPPLVNTKRSNEFIATRILNGKPGRMPAFGGNLDDQQLNDLIAFIHSIKPEDAQ
jgi:mono/diheme cytochrome c family protein